MGREQRSRNGGRFRGGRGNGGSEKEKKKDKAHKAVKSSTPKKETLKDHVFNFSSAKNASEFNTNARFIINYIRRTYDEGRDIADALEKGQDMDFDAIAPKTKPIMADPTTNPLAYKTMKLQHAKDYKIARQTHNDRMERYQKNQDTVSALLYSRCSSSMKSQLQARMLEFMATTLRVSVIGQL